MEEFDFDEYKGKTILIIGELVQEGVTTKIQSLGYAYKQKRLIWTTPNNWIATKELLSDLRQSNRLIAVFVHLTESLIFMCDEPIYKQIWSDLLDEFVHCKTLFFVYEDNLAGLYAQDPYTDESKISKAKQLIRDLFSSGATIIPYKKRINLTTAIQDYLDNLENGILLRLYVPNKQYQEEQLASFLRLLENYLQTVEKISFSIDVRKTEHGHIYEFKSKKDIQTADDLNKALARFEEFMELCQNDIKKARQMLENTLLTQSDVEHLLSRYIREYRRLKMDIRHEYEQKILALKQRLESDILEGECINNYELALPGNPAALLSIPNNLGGVNVSIGQIFYGDIHYNQEDRLLIEFFEKYAEKLDKVGLKSSLSELNDESAQKEKRQTAKQKIAGFLYKILPIIGESTVKVLIEYLEKKLITGL